MKNKNNIISKFAQSCESKECREKFKADIIKGYSETVTTPHELDRTLGTITCIYCGKVSKLPKRK